MSTSEGEEPMRRQHYVYVLRDPAMPAGEDIFYVGKGQGNRALMHELEAFQQAPDPDSNSQKIQRIHKILARGDRVQPLVIGRFDTSEEAYAVEAILIHWVYGFSGDGANTSLTNKQAGHGSRHVRARGNIDTIEGLDIPRSVQRSRVFDGTFTQQVLAANSSFGVETKLEHLRNLLIDYEPEWENSLSQVDLSQPKDPSIFLSVGGLAKIQMLLRSTGPQRVIFNVRSVDGSKSSLDRFFKLANRLIEHSQVGEVKMPNSRSPYFKLRTDNERIPIDRPEQIFAQLNKQWQVVAYWRGEFDDAS